jgi:hypothetical protein
VRARLNTRLRLHEDLVKTFASTNLIESCLSGAAAVTHRVKRWRRGEIFLRWIAAALLFAEEGFRKVRGYRHASAAQKSTQPTPT